jgi:general nucleoside transport system permease protein
MNRYSFASSLTPVASTFMVILGAFLVGGVFLAVVGQDVGAAYGMLVGRGLLSGFAVTETLIKMAPMLMISAGLLIAIKSGVWNIGMDGQFLVGACVAGVVAAALVGVVPAPLVIASSMAAAFAAGMAWGLLPALLKVRYGLNEIITTIMTNYLAIYLTSWLVKGPFKDPTSVPPQTAIIPIEFRLAMIPGTKVHVGIVLGLICLLAVALVFRYTSLGFKFWVLGQNKRVALHAGLPVGLLTALALLLSAGFAGLAGANDVLGTKGLFQGEWNPGYGLTGFTLVFLARLESLWVLPFAYFFSFLAFGGELMARSAGIPTYFVQLLEGLMLMFFAASVYLERSLAARGRKLLGVAVDGGPT